MVKVRHGVEDEWESGVFDEEMANTGSLRQYWGCRGSGFRV